jgi:hypothetical protein
MSRRTRGVVLAWLGVLLLLAVGALSKRAQEHLRLRRQVAAELHRIAEVDQGTVDDYLWGGGSPAWDSRLGEPQALAIYLLNRGYASPDLERGLLLCEALRVYDWKYLYEDIHNYDLRSRLIAHCIKAFPQDARVRCAAGELALADGDFDVAARELGATFDLANSPESLQALCGGLGISRQHLHGRYACALTLTGDWAGADKQTALAAQAGDGAPAPEGDGGDGDFYGNADVQQAAAQRAAAEEQRREQAREYGATHNASLLAPWLKQIAALQAEAAALPPTDSKYNSADEQRSALDTDLLRAYLLAHEWDKAAAVEADLDKLQNYAAYDSTTQLGQLSGLLLTRLAQRQKLGQTAEEYEAQERAELEKTYSGPDYSALTAAQREQMIHYELAWDSHGELSGLLAADYLPFLLRTDGFADALRHSGRPLGEVLQEVQVVAQPQRGLYGDSSNDKLRWK